MILFYTPNSPFARTARIALREWGILEQTEERIAANRETHNPVLKFSPVGRVPTLIDGDLVITEARDVFAYIQSRSTALSQNDRGWTSVAAQGQVLGFLEGVAALVRENRREENQRSSFLIAVERDRIYRCLPHLEQFVAKNHVPSVSEFSGAALASALALVSLHHINPGWEELYPRLAIWLDF